MKFQVSSDIHLDHLTFYNPASFVTPIADILILAGDVCYAHTMEKHKKFFNYLNNSFKKIIYVAGNHEFYYGDDDEKWLQGGSWRSSPVWDIIQKVEGPSNINPTSGEQSIHDIHKFITGFLLNYPNFIYLNNDTVKIENFIIAGSILWFQAKTLNPWFRIPFIQPEDISKLHDQALKFLSGVKEDGYTHIFVTHYPMYYPTTSKLLDVSEESMSDEDRCEDIFYSGFMPDIWISGHTHRNVIEEVNETVFLSNQRKGKNYSSSFIIETE